MSDPTIAMSEETTVGLYRELAVARPDAFRPELAVSLSVLADCLEANGRLSEAAKSDQESVVTLAPALAKHPTVSKIICVEQRRSD
jgi:hypothetical protein